MTFYVGLPVPTNKYWYLAHYSCNLLLDVDPKWCELDYNIHLTDECYN